MIIVTFEPWHLDQIKLQSGDQDDLKLFGGKDAFMETNFASTYTFTGFADDSIVGIGGVAELWQGVGEAWLFLSETGKASFPLSSAKMIKKFFDIAYETLDLHRIQANVKSENETANRFAEFLGFTKEGLMKAFGLKQEDYWRYSKVWLQH